jgi:hypothetical protein
MRDSKISVGLLGHSFIRRLQYDINHKLLPSNYDLEKCFLFQKGISGFSVCENYQGIMGCTEHFKESFHNFLRTEKPQIIILQLGENDIVSAISPLSLASTLEEIGLMIVKCRPMKIVNIP